MNRHISKYFIYVFVTSSVLISPDVSSQWNPLNSGTTNDLFSLFFLNIYTGYVVGNSGTILKSTNFGANWYQQVSGLGVQFRSVVFKNSTTGLSGALGGFIYKTVNGGTTWYPVSSGIPANVNNFQFLYGHDTGWYAGTDYPTSNFSRVMRTNNFGENWYQQYSQQGILFGACYFFDMNNGWVAGDEILKTTNGGTNWQVVFASLNNINSIWFTNLQTGYAVTYNVYKSSDGGFTWTFLSSPGIGAISNIYFVNTTTGWILGSTGSHILITRDSGLTWSEQQINGPPVTGLNAGRFPLNPANSWVVGNGGVILATSDSGVTRIHTLSSEVPKEFRLYENYPNPFNSNTIIKFDLPKDGLVTIKVYDLLGKVVSSMVELKKAGSYEYDFDGSNIATGLYFYRMESGSFTDTKKMILIK